MDVPSSPWEFSDLGDHLLATVGSRFGPDPVAYLAQIRAERRAVALDILGKLRLTRESVGIDLGSGPGYIAAEIAPRVRHLHCVDVSASFLDIARTECDGFENVSFHHIRRGRLPDLAPESLDFIYSHAVFIHLPLTEIEDYLASAIGLLKPGGLMNFGLIHSHDRVAWPLPLPDDPYALRAHSPRSVLRLAWRLGFRPFFIWYGRNATAELILRKGGYSPFGTLRTYLRQTKARFSNKSELPS